MYHIQPGSWIKLRFYSKGVTAERSRIAAERWWWRAADDRAIGAGKDTIVAGAHNIGAAGIIPYRAALVGAGSRKGHKAGAALADNDNPIDYHCSAYSIERSIGRIGEIEGKIYIAGAGIAGLLTAFYYSYR